MRRLPLKPLRFGRDFPSPCLALGTSPGPPRGAESPAPLPTRDGQDVPRARRSPVTSVEDVLLLVGEVASGGPPGEESWGELGGWDVQVDGEEGDAQQPHLHPPLLHPAAESKAPVYWDLPRNSHIPLTHRHVPITPTAP